MSVIDIDDMLGSSKKSRNHHPAGWGSRRVKIVIKSRIKLPITPILRVQTTAFSTPEAH